MFYEQHNINITVKFCSLRRYIGVVGVKFWRKKNQQPWSNVWAVAINGCCQSKQAAKVVMTMQAVHGQKGVGEISLFI